MRRSALRAANLLKSWFVAVLAYTNAVSHYRAARRVAAERGGRLSRADRRSTRDYARRILGSTRYRWWLRTYTLYRGEFVPGWIPDDFFGEHVLPVANNDYRGVSDAKTLSRRILQTDLLPDVAYWVHGAWYDRDLLHISHDAVREICFPSGEETVMLKQELSNQGRGVQPLKAADFDGLECPPHSHFVLQRWITPHGDIASLFPDCPVTVRVTTVNSAGKVRIANQYLRVGRPGESWIRSATQFVFPLDPVGRLLETGMDADWRRLDRHPETGARLLGKTVVGFSTMAEACCEMHARVPQFMIVGWDVIVDADGRPVIFEWNTEWPGIARGEAIVGPTLGGLGLERMRASAS